MESNNNDKKERQTKHNISTAENFYLREIKAETILALEEITDFSILTKENSGTFCRNYSSDIIDCDNINNTITLSRDSIYKLLPEALFFEEEELRNSKNFKDTSDKIKEKKKEISYFFQPFDTEYFKLSLTLEKEINKISEKSNKILLDLFFEKNKIAKINPIFSQFLLPQINQIKGNELLIIDILKIILKVKKIELIEINNYDKRFIIHIPNLSKDEYFQKTQEVSDIFEILKEYFSPFDTNYDFKIKDREQKFILGKNLILDYNVNII